MNEQQSIEEQVCVKVKAFANQVKKGYTSVDTPLLAAEATADIPLRKLDYWERYIREVYEASLQTSAKANWTFWKNTSNVLTWLDVINWNGRKREAALRTISGPAPNCFLFALGLRRLNDWAPQVRAAAREKLPKIASESDPNIIAQALEISLPSLHSWGRMKPKDRAVMLDIASLPEVAFALKEIIISSSSGPMAFLMSQLGRKCILDSYLHEIAQHAIQPSVRAKAYRILFESRVVWLEGREFRWTDQRYCLGKVFPIIQEREIVHSIPTIALLRESAKDTSSIVRRVSAEILIRDLLSLGKDAIELAQQFSEDPSKPVSERGDFAIKKWELEMNNSQT